MSNNDCRGARIVRLPEVLRRTGLSRSSIYLKVKEGSFPAPVSLGLRAVGWVDTSITQWVQARIDQSADSPPRNGGRA
jgi:prophage regulatory protein